MSQVIKNDLDHAQQLHSLAMDHAEEAYVAKMRGNIKAFEDSTRLALELETQAASIVAPFLDFEPSRSVLFRSAASLALDIHEYRIAEKLICTGLAGNPPLEIAEELRFLYEQSQFEHHT